MRDVDVTIQTGGCNMQHRNLARDEMLHQRNTWHVAFANGKSKGRGVLFVRSRKIVTPGMKVKWGLFVSHTTGASS